MPNYFECFLKSFNEVHSYETRGRDDFSLKHKKSKSGQNSLFFKRIVQYNKLPSNIKAT